MKLEVTEKYLSEKKRGNTYVYILFLFLVFALKTNAQEYKLVFDKDTQLSEAILISSKQLNFKVAFDAKRLGEKSTIGEFSGKTRDEFVSNLLKNSGFTFVYKHGCYLIVEGEGSQPESIPNELQLTGSVIDVESGEQLPFASIIIASQNILVSASTNGTFSIKNIVSNPVRIGISYIGYFPVDTLISWSDPIKNLTFRLRHKTSVIDSVNVKADKVEMVDYRSDVDFATTVNPSKLIDMPQLVETDIFRTLQLLPGISYSENSSELSIRGGSSDQNLILFDGQTLYNLSHYYGVFSSINPNIVKDIQVYKGGFDSRYGERISGVVDITGKSGNLLRPKVIADVNLLSLNLAAEVPVSRKLTFVLAGRRSYSDIYKTSFAGNIFEKNSLYNNLSQQDSVVVSEPSFFFYDLNAKLNYRISNKENISLSASTGRDFFKNAYETNSTYRNISYLDSNSWSNYGVSLCWQKQWNNSFFSNILIGSSGYKNFSVNTTDIVKLKTDGHDQAYLPDSQNVFTTSNHNSLNDFSVSMKNTLSIDNFNLLDFGFLVRQNGIYYHKDADKVYVYDNLNQSAWISSVFLQDKISLSQNIILKPGFRLSYYNGDHNVYFEPRFALKYNVTERFSCRLATGRYTQFISQVLSPQETGYIKSIWVLANDSVNPVLEANHYIVGLTFENKKFLADIEGYYKSLSGIQEYVYISQYRRNKDFVRVFPSNQKWQDIQTNQNKPSYFITGTGKSYGLDFFVRYKSSNYTSWLSYSLSQSVEYFDKINNNTEIPAFTDQRHQLSFSNLYTFKRWNFGAVSVFSTGRPYLAYEADSLFSGSHPTNTGAALSNIRVYKRMPNYFRTDVSATYNFVFKLTSVKLGVSIINLFNNQNYFDINTRTFNFESSTFSETNLIQSQKLSFNVFIHVVFW
jgi:ferric enterobactin receptor